MINLIKLIGLITIVAAWPVYALNETERMEKADIQLRQQALQDGARIYVESCAMCHGSAGEGLGSMPALNNPGLASADEDSLFSTIAGASHGTTMAAWHMEKGGILNTYQIHELVTLIKYADWGQVEKYGLAMGNIAPIVPAFETSVAYLESEVANDPHTCFACHEEPEVHQSQFGIKCARCHTTTTWLPAQLSKHIFRLDHGGQGDVTCETCHTSDYVTNSCYGCHDHQPEQIAQVHNELDIANYEKCEDCHPTGKEGEAEKIMQKKLNQTSSLSGYAETAQEALENE